MTSLPDALAEPYHCALFQGERDREIGNCDLFCLVNSQVALQADRQFRGDAHTQRDWPRRRAGKTRQKRIKKRLRNGGSIIEQGNVGLARFGNISGLRPSGGAQFVATEESGPAIVGVPMGDGYGQVIQGHLEASNAAIADELVKLMRAQQAYAGSSRLLQSAVEMSKRLTS